MLAILIDIVVILEEMQVVRALLVTLGVVCAGEGERVLYVLSGREGDMAASKSGRHVTF